ncbi:MAG: hypothetical protein [Microviridae sp.]|nr:MAG: hypothetical protein [Microviridae sp.]
MCLMLSLLNVSVTNFPVLSVFISSCSLTPHALAFWFLHSIHFWQPTGTYSTLLSVHVGGLPLFFLFGTYFLFFISFGYRHIFVCFDFRVKLQRVTSFQPSPL